MPTPSILDALYPLFIILKFIGSLWWLWGFFLLLFIFEGLWLFNKQAKYKNYEWVLLEIKVPREVQKPPKAMEQVLMNLHSLRNAASDLLEKYKDGEVTLWWSLELASYGGEIHFYIRAPRKHKSMTEASLYAQYPNVEIVEVPDYVDKLPNTTAEFYKIGQQIFGSEVILSKDDVYPIRTYEEFKTPPEEGEALDPISSLIETLGKIDRKENFFLQILIRPADDTWTKKAAPIIKKFRTGSKIEETSVNAKGETITFARQVPLTPGETDTLKAIERNVSKPGFETLIRFLYTAPKEIFNTNFARRGLKGALNQYAAQNLNSFRFNYKTETRTCWIHFPHFFSQKRGEARRQRLLENFRKRKLPEELFTGKVLTSHPLNFNFASHSYVLNVEELATIYHLPSKAIITAPHIKLEESKKMGPPAGLAIYED